MFMFCVDEVGCNSAVVCLFNVNYQINVDDKFQNALHREIGKKTSHNSAVVSKKVMFDAYIKADEPILTSVFFSNGFLKHQVDKYSNRFSAGNLGAWDF